MFWNKKKKLPISEEDRLWINEELDWLKSEFGDEHFLSHRTVTPTTNFFSRTFDKSEKDAIYILERVKELMGINKATISLEFYDDSIVLSEDGSILTTPADINGKWESSAGIYDNNGEETTIYIERSQLKDTFSLIATISHELAHQILLGENRIEENDEYLTDLTAISYGFGIFLGNSSFKFSQFATADGFGWESSSQGYLPGQIIAYTMAKLSKDRDEDLSYNQYMSKTIKKYFDECVEWLIENE